MSVLYRKSTSEEVQAILHSIGWRFDDWLYAAPDDGSKPAQTFQHMAPTDAFSLQSFSLVATEWLERSNGELIVLNAPNQYELVDEAIIGRALFGDAYLPGSLQYGSHVIAEHENNGANDVTHRVRIAQVILQTFICSGHCQILPISRRPGRVLSVQDGCLYLHNYGPELAAELVGLEAGLRPAWALNEQ